MPCYPATVSIAASNTSGGGGTTTVTVFVTAGGSGTTVTCNAVLSRGIIIKNHVYLLGNATPMGGIITGGSSGLHIINPTLSLSGTVNGNVNPGATVNVTTTTPDSLVINTITNQTDLLIHTGKLVSLLWDESASAFAIISCPVP
jgi:hypothetical protein